MGRANRGGGASGQPRHLVWGTCYGASGRILQYLVTSDVTATFKSGTRLASPAPDPRLCAVLGRRGGETGCCQGVRFGTGGTCRTASGERRARRATSMTPVRSPGTPTLLLDSQDRSGPRHIHR